MWNGTFFKVELTLPISKGNYNAFFLVEMDKGLNYVPSTSPWSGKIQYKESFRNLTHVSLYNNRFGQFQTTGLNLFVVKPLGESFCHELAPICRHTHILRLDIIDKHGNYHCCYSNYTLLLTNESKEMYWCLLVQ